jgi:LmbE family N-acetylglucosaminyl deacetylase
MMLPLGLPPRETGGYEVLCLGAHSDDIEIGCGGTMLRLLRDFPVARVVWVVLSGNAARAKEARRSARRILGRRVESRIIQCSFRESYFPYTAVPIKEFFDTLKDDVRPDLVLTHYRNDLHQDHRIVSELTYHTFRDHLVLEYEIVKLDGDVGNPNVYVPLDAGTVRRKLQVVMSSFASQRDKRWFSEDVFRAIMRLRGVEAGAPSGYAEAFYGRKLVI